MRIMAVIGKLFRWLCVGVCAPNEHPYICDGQITKLEICYSPFQVIRIIHVQRIIHIQEKPPNKKLQTKNSAEEEERRKKRAREKMNEFANNIIIKLKIYEMKMR